MAEEIFQLVFLWKVEVFVYSNSNTTEKSFTLSSFGLFADEEEVIKFIFHCNNNFTSNFILFDYNELWHTVWHIAVDSI